MEFSKFLGNYPMRGVVLDSGFKFTHYLYSKLSSNKFGDLEITSPATYDGSDFEFYNLNVDPHETNNLLTRLGPTDNPLMRTLQDQSFPYHKQLKEAVLALVDWQVKINDFKKIQASELNIETTNETGKIKLIWQTNNPTFVIVFYKESECSNCQPTELIDYQLTNDHNLEITGLKANTLYEFKIYSISKNGNGDLIKRDYFVPLIESTNR
jgi:hypothetical protein